MGALGFPDGTEAQNSPINAGRTKDTSSIPKSGLSLGIGNGNPLQYSCLENPMGKGAWWATTQGVTKSRTQLSDQAHTPTDDSIKSS